MILIGENIHVISNSVRDALIKRDEEFITKLINVQSDMDYIDLNIGPAKNNLEGIFEWLVPLVEKTELGISFDTTNILEMEKGVKTFHGESFINSTSKDEPKLSKYTDLAAEYNSNLVALTMSKETGIPKTADERLEIAFEIYEKCMEKNLSSEKIYFDPLILPICVEQSQGMEALNTIKMIKESFDPAAKTIIGLSNISNGTPERQLLNRVFAVLAFGSGLDAAIIDACDLELIRIIKMLETKETKYEYDELLINLADMAENFYDIEDIEYNKNSEEQIKIIKAAKILLNKEIYSHSFTQI